MFVLLSVFSFIFKKLPFIDNLNPVNGINRRYFIDIIFYHTLFTRTAISIIWQFENNGLCCLYTDFSLILENFRFVNVTLLS